MQYVVAITAELVGVYKATAVKKIAQFFHKNSLYAIEIIPLTKWTTDNTTQPIAGMLNWGLAGRLRHLGPLREKEHHLKFINNFV